MKVEAELKTMYKITVGDNGMCMGQYYSEDDWKESYYGESLKEIAEKLSIEYFNGLPKTFELDEVQVLIYDNIKYDYKTLGEYNSYRKDNILKKEYDEFWQYWKEFESDRKKMKEIHQLKKEREEKLKQIKKEEELKKKKLEEYLKLKKEFEK